MGKIPFFSNLRNQQATGERARTYVHSRAARRARAPGSDFATLLNGDSVRRARSLRDNGQAFCDVSPTARGKEPFSPLINSCKPTDPRELASRQRAKPHQPLASYRTFSGP
jgi:hypothetical protein